MRFRQRPNASRGICRRKAPANEKGAGSLPRLCLPASRRPWIVSPFHGNGETIYLFVFTQFRTQNRFALLLELL